MKSPAMIGPNKLANWLTIWYKELAFVNDAPAMCGMTVTVVTSKSMDITAKIKVITYKMPDF